MATASYLEKRLQNASRLTSNGLIKMEMAKSMRPNCVAFSNRRGDVAAKGVLTVIAARAQNELTRNSHPSVSLSWEAFSKQP